MQDKEITLIQRKLLYIDPLSSHGHVNFNKIYIDALFEIFDSIDFAFRLGYEKNFPIPINSKVYSIPEKYYISSNNKIANRLKFFQINKFIEKHCKLNQYDFVIFSSYEEISLYLSFLSKTLIIVNHNNLCGLYNPIKFHFFKKLANKNINIVFENYMKSILEQKGVKNTYVIHHGLPSPFSTSILNDTSLKRQFSILNNYKYVIFAPSGSSVDKMFLNDLNSNRFFQSFLERHEIFLIIKDKHMDSKHSNILVIKNYLTDLQHQYLFLISNIILISYPHTFTFRVSAVLFEAMSNNKLCILSDIPALNNYMDYFNYDPYFENIEELTKKISLIIELPGKIKNNPYRNTNKLNPDFSLLFTSVTGN